MLIDVLYSSLLGASFAAQCTGNGGMVGSSVRGWVMATEWLWDAVAFWAATALRVTSEAFGHVLVERQGSLGVVKGSCACVRARVGARLGGRE